MYVEFGGDAIGDKGTKDVSSLECPHSLAQWLTQALSLVKFLASRGGEYGPRGSRVVAACPFRDRSGRIFAGTSKAGTRNTCCLGILPLPPMDQPGYLVRKRTHLRC